MARIARSLCAICDATNATTRICPSCRKDPANDGWCERPDDEDSTAEVDEFSAGLAALVVGRRLKKTTPLEDRILALLSVTTHAAIRRYRRRNGIVVVERALTMRQIAAECGCSAMFVYKTRKRYWR